MRILFDHGTPAPLRRSLTAHTVSTAHEMGWSALDNGALLSAAETAFDVSAAETAFDALVTTDQNLRYQQNLEGRGLAILALPTTSWLRIRTHELLVVAAVDALRPGDFVELKFPQATS